MSDAVHRRLTELLGGDNLSRSATGKSHVFPEHTESVAEVVALAFEEGWRLAVSGSESWHDVDPRADIIISTRRLNGVRSIHAEDLYLEAGCGSEIALLTKSALDHQTFLPLDPPLGALRSIGSVLGTATSGPLQHGFGPVRDQLLGLTVVNGRGEIVRTGGATVKNVAGFDLLKLQVGGFGAFGILTECTLRLRAQPPHDTTLVVNGERDLLTAAARVLGESDIEAVAVELISPRITLGRNWVLAVRLMGDRAVLKSQATRLPLVEGSDWLQLKETHARDLWSWVSRSGAPAPLSIRLGTLPDGIDNTIDLIGEELDGGDLTVGMLTGMIRWSGDAPADALLRLRHRLAQREIPMTLERAPWPIRHAVGHFGAYHEGVGLLVSKLRQVFDPAALFQVVLDTGPGDAGQ